MLNVLITISSPTNSLEFLLDKLTRAVHSRAWRKMDDWESGHSSLPNAHRGPHTLATLSKLIPAERASLATCVKCSVLDIIHLRQSSVRRWSGVGNVALPREDAG